jgi:hypothetical protein
LIAEAAGSVELRNVARWSAVAAIPSEFLAVQIDRVGIPLRHPAVTETVANPTQWDTIPVAVECLTWTTVTTTVCLTDNVCTLLPRGENAAEEFTDKCALAIAHIAIEAACPEPRFSAVVLPSHSDTNRHQCKHKHTTKAMGKKIDHATISPPHDLMNIIRVESTPPPEAVHSQMWILGRPSSTE